MINRNMASDLRLIIAAAAFAVIMLLPVSASAEDVFAELSEMENVESTYVSGRFAHNKKRWYSASQQHAMDLSRGFSALYTYQCYSEESVSKAKSILKAYLKKNPDIEVVMKTTQGMQEYVVYEKFSEDGKLVKQMIIWNNDAPNVCEIVVVDWNKGLVPTQSPYSWNPKESSGISNSLALLGKEFNRNLGESISNSIETAFSSLNWSALEKLGDYDWNALENVFGEEESE